MKEPDVIRSDYKQRMHEILDQSWKIFKSQFIHQRYFIETEAPFQHHLAYIIRSVGELYSLNKRDLFKVDLERKVKDIRGRNKYFDIACQFEEQINCLIELKFKLRSQGAQKYSRVEVYSDLEALELSQEKGFQLGKFYMITDDTAFINMSVKGWGTTFSVCQDHVNEPGKILTAPSRNGIDHFSMKLKNKYKFDWEKINDRYFLDLTVHNHEQSIQ